MRFPVYLRYDLKDDGDEFKIAALYAFWELPAMVGQLLAQWYPVGLPPSD